MIGTTQELEQSENRSMCKSSYVLFAVQFVGYLTGCVCWRYYLATDEKIK
jgi:hypothetical protein